MNNLAEILKVVSGGMIINMDTEVEVPLTGGKNNPMQGRVTKRTTGSSVMLFQNKATNAYKAMVERRLVTEGKDPASFELQPRKWGERLPNTPIVRHTKDQVIKYYLEAIFMRAGESEYFLDGQHINKDQVIGLPVTKPSGQGGLENQVIIRSYALDSIRAMRMVGHEFTGKFGWDADVVLGESR